MDPWRGAGHGHPRRSDCTILSPEVGASETERAAAAAASAEAAAARAAEAAVSATNRIEPVVPSPWEQPEFIRRAGTPEYERCSTANRAPAPSAKQAQRIAHRFLRCLHLDWGKVRDVAFVERENRPGMGCGFYRVEYDGDGWHTVLVAEPDGHADFPLPR